MAALINGHEGLPVQQMAPPTDRPALPDDAQYQIPQSAGKLHWHGEFVRQPQLSEARINALFADKAGEPSLDELAQLIEDEKLFRLALMRHDDIRPKDVAQAILQHHPADVLAMLMRTLKAKDA